MIEPGIYIIRNLVNRKVYVGSAVNLGHRWSAHFRRLRRGVHSNAHLQAAWNKYGSEAFEFLVLLRCVPEELLFWEQRAIDSYASECRYNINPIAGSALGAKRSPEVRARMAGINKGRVHTPEARANMSRAALGNQKGLGHRCSAESRAKMSEARRGCTFSSEHRAKLAEAKRGKKRGPHSPETRAKMVAAWVARRGTSD